MAELVNLMQDLGLEKVKTYIQSGNALFHTNKTDKTQLAEILSEAIKERKGFKPGVFVLELDELQQAATANPFPEATDEPKTLHLYFLAEHAKNPDLTALEKLKKDSEAFRLIDKVFYLYAPEGIGRSKLAEKVERLLGVSVTARNWRTVTTLLEL